MTTTDDHVGNAIAQRNEARDRIRALEEALGPFGALAFHFDHLEDDGGSILVSVFLGHIRRAKQVLEGKE